MRSLCLDVWKVCLKLCILTILAHMGGWTQSGWIPTKDPQYWHRYFHWTAISIHSPYKSGIETSCLHLKLRLLSTCCFHLRPCEIEDGPPLVKRLWLSESIDVNIEELWDHYADMSLVPAICLILGSTGLSLGDSVGPRAGEYNCVGGNISADTATI